MHNAILVVVLMMAGTSVSLLFAALGTANVQWLLGALGFALAGLIALGIENKIGKWINDRE